MSKKSAKDQKPQTKFRKLSGQSSGTSLHKEQGQSSVSTTDTLGVPSEKQSKRRRLSAKFVEMALQQDQDYEAG